MTTDTLSPAARSERMSRVRSRNTKPEMVVRRLVHGMGYRYRLHDKLLPGSPDLVFSGRRKVIFVHGCFWHRHPDPTCRLARMPKSRQEFWGPKLEGNRERDERTREGLDEGGWRQMIVWECECRLTEQLKNRVSAFLEGEGVDHARH
jgi:DNA mismatch endonuclease, patch repair protein